MIRRGDDDDEDRKRVLRDGERLRVPLWMMDGTQREIAQRWRQEVTVENKGLVIDALGQSGLALHRPGARYLAPRALHKTDYARQVTLDYMKREAYRLADEADANAYRNVEAKSGIWPLNAGAREGDACDLNGERGTLVREGDHLACRIARPVSPPRSSGALIAAELEAAYRAYDEDASQAWRNPR